MSDCIWTTQLETRFLLDLLVYQTSMLDKKVQSLNEACDGFDRLNGQGTPIRRRLLEGASRLFRRTPLGESK